MRLIDRNRTPIGGFYYDDPVTKRPIVTDGNFDALIRSIKMWYQANKIAIPDNLTALVEDQICTRQPKNRCRYTKGLGDQIARGIHTVAAVADTLTKGKFKLEKKARRCGACSRRRVKLN